MTRKLQIDLIWNYASLGVLAASGVALNWLIAHFYGSATLGAFNQVLAAFIVSSMIASGGLNFSVLRAVAEHSADPAKLRAIVAGALFPGILLAAATSAALYAAASPISRILESTAAFDGIRAVAPGLFFFALNKVLLAVVNGLGRMRAYAVYQALRYLLIIGGLLMAVGIELPGRYLPGIFTFAEVILFLVLIVEVSIQIPWWRANEPTTWSKDHLHFAAKGITSGVLVELNSRVDVLLLGYFLDDSAVGVYSFAAFFAEGFFQLLVVLQNNYHPLLAQHLATKKIAELEVIIRRTRVKTYALMIPLALVSALLFPIFIPKPELAESAYVYAILAAGIALASGYLVFQNTLFMANRPGWQTAFMSTIVLINAAGNVALIPVLGIKGAATATGLSFLLSAPILYVLVKKIVGLKI